MVDRGAFWRISISAPTAIAILLSTRQLIPLKVSFEVVSRGSASLCYETDRAPQVASHEYRFTARSRDLLSERVFAHPPQAANQLFGTREVAEK